MVALTNRMFVAVKNAIYNFTHEENGDVNTTSMVVLIGIALALAVIFRQQIQAIITKALNKTNENADKAIQ